MHLTATSFARQWGENTTANDHEERTEWEGIHNMEVDRTLAEGFQCDFRELNEGVVFREHLDTVRNLHNVRACHAKYRP